MRDHMRVHPSPKISIHASEKTCIVHAHVLMRVTCTTVVLNSQF